MSEHRFSKTCKWMKITWKEIEHHYPLGNCTSELHKSGFLPSVTARIRDKTKQECREIETFV